MENSCPNDHRPPFLLPKRVEWNNAGPLSAPREIFMETIAPGEVIAGKYRIEREIGRGGMGVVFAALHIDLDQPVAVKILHEYAAYDQAAIARFLREARAAAKISSNHVVRVMDVGSLPEGGAYITMELLDGRDLADVLREQGPLGVTEAVDCLVEACDAVAAAHGAGIIHRDLKPANLFVSQTSDGTSAIKVLDFGVSKIIPKSGEAPASGDLTQTGQIFGSPNYMSPEQLRNAAHVDGRTDVWALGVVFYELVSGKLPFTGTSMADVLAAVVRDTPALLSNVCPDVPVELAHVVARCLEKEAHDRYADIVEFAQALAPFASPDKQALIARLKRVVAIRAAAPSRPGTDLFPTPSRGVSRDKHNTPNMVAVATGSRSGSSRIDSTSPQQAPAKTNRGLLFGGAALLIVGIGMAATRVATSGAAAEGPSTVHATTPVASPALSETSVAPVIASSAPEVPAVRPAEPTPSAAIVQSKVKFEFTTKPAKVQVLRDNVVIGTTPLAIEFPQGRTSIKLVFSAWGYRSQEVTIVPEADRVMAIELSPAGAVRPNGTVKTGGRLPGDLEPF